MMNSVLESYFEMDGKWIFVKMDSALKKKWNKAQLFDWKYANLSTTFKIRKMIYLADYFGYLLEK